MKKRMIAALTLLATSPVHAQPAIETEQIAGLLEPAEIVVDKWGVPHIYANTPRDAYFLQGYNAARDRLWQIDLWRKRGLGLLSESFGKAYLKQDRAARLFLYRGDMAAEWRSYGPAAEEQHTAFAEGINAFVSEVLAGKKPLPVEFGLTDSTPSLWSPEDIVRIRSHALVYNAGMEVQRARLMCAGGVLAVRLNQRNYPEHNPVVPEGLAPCTIGPAILDDYRLAVAPVKFDAASRSLQTAFDATAEVTHGSNNWAIAGSRTTTGRPIFAGDPHRHMAVPSLRYIVHLEAPGLSLIGAGEPSLPGVTFGHNGQAAFGLTVFKTDQEDVYVYETKPGEPDFYRYKGNWEKIKTLREMIPVKGEKPVTVDLSFTRHGPVMYRDAQTNRAYALRSVWLQTGTSGYTSASWLANAANWEDFRKAADHWGTPPENLVWADATGSIAWASAGTTPVRRNWDGQMPVPGDGRYEWDGMLDPRALPSLKNPPAGFIATANEDRLTNFGGSGIPVSFDFSDPVRAKRLAELFAGQERFSVADAAAMQMDKFDLNAKRLLALIADLDGWDADSSRALEMLRSWDGETRPESAAAAIAETWFGVHLSHILTKNLLPAEAQAITRGSYDAALLMLEKKDAALGTDPVAMSRKVLQQSLAATLGELRQRLGPDMTHWTWGAVHQLELKPAIASLLSKTQLDQAVIGPVPVGGSSSTLALAHSDREANTLIGPSVRMVIDVGDWDKSLFVNMPGQSANPADSHYKDFLQGWLDGKFAPLLYSRNAVDGAAERIIRLSPSAGCSASQNGCTRTPSHIQNSE